MASQDVTNSVDVDGMWVRCLPIRYVLNSGLLNGGQILGIWCNAPYKPGYPLAKK
jgi:hypothetical protein